MDDAGLPLRRALCRDGVARAAHVSAYIGQEQVAAVCAAAPALKTGKGCLNIVDRTPLPLDALEAAFRVRLGV